MKINIISGVNYDEVESIFLQQQISSVGSQPDYWWAPGDEGYFSFDRTFIMQCKRRGEIRWGPSFYNIKIMNDKIRVIKKDFGDRVFWGNYICSPWSFDSQEVCLAELDSKGGSNDGKAKKLCVYNVREDMEFNFWGGDHIFFGAWSSTARYILFRDYFEDYNEVRIIDRNINRITTLGKSLPSQSFFSFFDVNDEVIILIDQERGPVVRVLRLPDLQLLMEESLALNIFDSVKRIVPKVKGSPYWIGKEGTSWTGPLNKKNCCWDHVFFDSVNNLLYLGILRAASWQKDNYYKTMEWLKVELVFEEEK